MSPSPRVSVQIPLPLDSWHGYASETVWAESADGEHFVVLNTPFYAKGLSFEDVIAAHLTPDGHVFDGVLARGGHSTYRIVPSRSTADLAEALSALEALGCTWEEGPAGMVALDVPPAVDIRDAYELLQAGLDLGRWDFEEGHVGHRIDRADAG
jgi:Domain of unknown function (DUF4265)